MHTLKTRLSIIAGFVLLLNGVVYCDFPITFLSGSLIAAEMEETFEEVKEFIPAIPRVKTGVKKYVEKNTYYSVLQTTVLNTEASEREQVFIPATPRLANGAKTYTNRNGFEVFHGYKYSDIPGNTHLKIARERLVIRNARRRYTRGAANFRETNYRKATYVSDLHASATTVPKPEPSRKLLANRREIGYSRDVQPQKTRIQRYSLRQSLRKRGVAESFKSAKTQRDERNARHSEQWAQNRTPRDETEYRSDRARIDVKQADSRKSLLEYYEQKRIEKAEFEAEIQRELNGETEE